MSLSCAVFLALVKQASHKGARKCWLSALATPITGWFLRAVLDGGTGTTASTCTPQPFTNSPCRGDDFRDGGLIATILQAIKQFSKRRAHRIKYGVSVRVMTDHRAAGGVHIQRIAIVPRAMELVRIDLNRHGFSLQPGSIRRSEEHTS